MLPVFSHRPHKFRTSIIKFCHIIISYIVGKRPLLLHWACDCFASARRFRSPSHRQWCWKQLGRYRAAERTLRSLPVDWIHFQYSKFCLLSYSMTCGKRLRNVQFVIVEDTVPLTTLSFKRRRCSSQYCGQEYSLRHYEDIWQKRATSISRMKVGGWLRVLKEFWI